MSTPFHPVFCHIQVLLGAVMEQPTSFLSDWSSSPKIPSRYAHDWLGVINSVYLCFKLPFPRTCASSENKFVAASSTSIFDMTNWVGLMGPVSREIKARNRVGLSRHFRVIRQRDTWYLDGFSSTELLAVCWLPVVPIMTPLLVFVQTKPVAISMHYGKGSLFVLP